MTQNYMVGTYGCTHEVAGSTLCGDVWLSIIFHLYFDWSPCV
jgi:hypothetical protein